MYVSQHRVQKVVAALSKSETQEEELVVQRDVERGCSLPEQHKSFLGAKRPGIRERCKR